MLGTLRSQHWHRPRYMAVSRLGKMYHVPTPRIDLLVDAYRYLLADQAELDGPVFDLDLSQVL